MTSCHRMMGVASLLALAAMSYGCKEADTGSLDHRDLGEGDRILLPTGLTLLNVGVAKGSAQWQELREPTFGQGIGVTSPAENPPPDDDVEENTADSPQLAELRKLIADYNAVVAEKNYDEMAGFLVESQVEPAEKLMRVVPALAARLLELNAALPEPNAELAAAAESISPTRLFHLDVGAIKIVSDTSATGELTAASGGGTIKFVVEEEDWYFEHPVVAAAADALDQLDQGVGALDQAITDIKAGAVTGDALNATLGAALDMLIPLTPDAAGDAPEPADTVGT